MSTHEVDEISLKWVKPNRVFGPPRMVLDQLLVVRGEAIPPGFRTDGATLPFFVRPYLSNYGPYLKAAIYHDYLLFCEVDRRQCAHEFKAALKDEGMPSWLTNFFFGAVRLNDHFVAVKEWFKNVVVR